MRLIYADDVIKHCCQFYGQCCRECEKCGFAKSVENIPTAYDVDKVVEELTAEKEKWERGCDEVKALENAQGFELEGLWRNLSGRAYGMKEAIDIVKIEIVKRGGVDEG